jgi:tetratricopeptide (TPR) repeat protein
VLGEAYTGLGDYEKAARTYEKATALNPAADNYYFEAAVAWDRLNRTAQAVSLAQKCIQLRPDRGIYHYMLGKLYAKLGRTSEAISELKTCVRLNPDLDYPYYALSQIYEKTGDRAQAQEWRGRFEEQKKAQTHGAGVGQSTEEPPAGLHPSTTPAPHTQPPR